MELNPMLCHTPDQTYMDLKNLASPMKLIRLPPNATMALLTMPVFIENISVMMETITTVEMK